MAYLQNAVQGLKDYGVIDILLPFMLIFTIVFAVLQKSKIFGEKGKKFNVIIALVIGLAVVVPHVTGDYSKMGFDVVDTINNALPGVSLVLVILISAFLLVGLWGGTPTWSGKATGWVALVFLLVVGYIFLRAGGWAGNLPTWLQWLDDPTTQAVVVIIIVFLVIIGYITGEDKTESTVGKGFEEFSKLFGKKD